jgi:hypothetical protein
MAKSKDEPRRKQNGNAVKYELILALFFVTLVIGVLGYKVFVGLPWIDAFFNASMVLSGAGLVAPITNTEAKIFVSIYAIFSGLFVIVILAFIIDELIHV